MASHDERRGTAVQDLRPLRRLPGLRTQGRGFLTGAYSSVRIAASLPTASPSTPITALASAGSRPGVATDTSPGHLMKIIAGLSAGLHVGDRDDVVGGSDSASGQNG